MGNIITPQSQSKNVKLKGTLFILRQQQSKLKNQRRQCTNKINASNRKLKYFLLQKSKSDFHDMMVDENIQECAEEIFHQKKKLVDLKACYDILNCLQYKVQNIMDAYYTHTTIQNVNNSIRDSNMNLQNEVQFDHGGWNIMRSQPIIFHVCRYISSISMPRNILTLHITYFPKNTGIQNLISELVKTQSINDHVSSRSCKYTHVKKMQHFHTYATYVMCHMYSR